MRALPVLREIFRRVSAPVSAEFRRERWGCSAAPGWINWVLVLMAVDLTVYLDYGHWHFVPALRQPIMQAVGLLLHVAAALWKRWTDRYLAAAFTNRAQPALVQSGPFRFIRHPYYAAALLDKLAVALIFASIAGWLLFIPWCVLLLRQVRLEESHMRTIFRDRYERYSRQTARLLPGVY